MSTPTKTIEIKVERVIPAPQQEVFDAWLDKNVSGTTWNAAEKLILDPKVDGLFYWSLRGNSHFGRFTEIDRPNRICHTWMSSSTLGQESTVTVSFKKQGVETLMTLVHSDLPDCDPARGHEKGWNYFMGIFLTQFGNGSRKEFRFEDAKTPDKK